MFRERDREEELRRLEQQLLEEEETEEEYLDEDALDELTDQPGENPRVYQNYSNHYGKDLRNFASGYRAYNADHTDTSPEELSEELLRPEERKKNGLWWLWLVAVVAIGMLVVSLLRLGGIL